tara:strand:+ start:1357 stop:1929 length:573 start_codon:yes stop_codon:yes gene_type:complete
MAPNLEFVARINAEPAKQALQDLSKQGSMVGGRMSAGVRKAVGFGLQATGLSELNPVNLLRSGVNSINQNGLQDIINETTQYAGNVASEFVTGDLDNQARAKAAARNDLLNMFQYEIGQNGGQITPPMMDYFNDQTSRHKVLEDAREKVLTDKRFYGPGITDLAQDAFDRMSSAVQEGFNNLAKAIKGML